MFFWDEDAEKLNEILTHIRSLHVKKLEEENENPYEKSDEKDIWHKLECLDDKFEDLFNNVFALINDLSESLNDIRKKIDCCRDNGPIVIEKTIVKKPRAKKKST